MDRKILAVDFDNTLFKTSYPNIDKPIWAIIDYVKSKQAQGYIIILWTCRHGQDLKEAIACCEDIGLNFDYVNENVPELVEKYGDCRKVFCDELIDDTAKIDVKQIIKNTYKQDYKRRYFKE